MSGQGGGFKVNRRAVLASSSREKLKRFCARLNLPPPVMKASYNKHLKDIEAALVVQAENKMNETAARLVNIVKAEEPSQVLDIPNDKLGDDRLGASLEGDKKYKTKASNVGTTSKDETSSACHNHEQMDNNDNTSFDENVTKISEDKRENEQILVKSVRESCKNIASILYDVSDFAVLQMKGQRPSMWIMLLKSSVWSYTRFQIRLLPLSFKQSEGSRIRSPPCLDKRETFCVK
eukprot:gene5774-11058_t